MPAPIIAALLRAAASSGGVTGAATRVGSASSYLGRAQAATAARGGHWRDAMQAAKGNSDVAREMISQRNADIREQEGMMRRQAMERERSPGFMDRLKQSPIETIAEGVTKSINQKTRIINDDYRGAAVSAFNGMGPLGGVMGKFIDAVGTLADGINAKGHALSPYSGELSGSVAMSRVRSLYADVDEAQRNGGAYGRVIDEQSKLQTNLQTAFVPIKEEIAKAVGDLLAFLNQWVEPMTPILELMKGHLYAIRQILQVVYASMGPVQALLAKWAKDDEKAKQDAEEAQKQLLKLWDDPLLELPPEPGPAGPPEDGGGMGFGLLDGF
jgi:hypothetical protein